MSWGRALALRYGHVSKHERSQILDQVCVVTGYTREYALTLLNKPPADQPPGKRTRHRSPSYGQAEVELAAIEPPDGQVPHAQRRSVLRGSQCSEFSATRGAVAVILRISVEAQLRYQRRNLGTAIQPESSEHLRDMVRYGAWGKHQLLGDLLIAEAVGDQNRHVELTRSQATKQSFERLAPSALLRALNDDFRELGAVHDQPSPA